MQARGINILLHAFILRCLPLLYAEAHATDLKELPDYIVPCYRDDPLLAECIKTSTYNILGKMVQGIPELDIQPIDPFFKDQIHAFTIGSLRLNIRNITIRGLNKLKIVKNSASTKTRFFTYNGEIDSLEFGANYELSGFFFVPIHAASTIHAIGKGIECKVDAIFDTLTKHDVEVANVRDLHIKVKINDGSLRLSNLGQNEEAVNLLLNDRQNAKLIMNQFAVIIEGVVASLVEKLSNRIYNSVPFDIIFPKGTGPDPVTYV